MYFSESIKKLRTARGLTQEQLASAIGVSRSAISMYESGDREPNFEICELLADFFNCRLSDIIEKSSSFSMTSSDKFEIPLVGRIACGTPATAEENVEDYIPVPKGLKCEFALTAKGDSMVGDRITSGDIVYIRQQAVVPNGCIAAVLVDGEEATLKHIYYENDKIILRGSNPEFEDIVVRGDQLENVRILGRAVAITTFI